MRQSKAAFDHLGANREGPVRMNNRPGVLVLFVECRDVVIRDITVLDAPNWCIHLACCKYALLTGLNVRCSLLVPNADAIDVASSQNMRISDSYFEAGDDGIAISPCADGYCQMSAENIAVSNCVIVSRSAGVRLGWAARDIRNLTFENLIIRDSNRGICVQVRGTETIESVDNLHLYGFDVDWQGVIPDSYVSGVKIETFKNVRIDDFTGRGPRGSTPAIVLRDGDGATVRDSQATAGKLLLLE
jgi:polygalacturonase